MLIIHNCHEPGLYQRDFISGMTHTSFFVKKFDYVNKFDGLETDKQLFHLGS